MPGPKGGPGICNLCKKQKEYLPIYGRNTGVCKTCYKKLIWKPELKECKRCGRMLPIKSKGLCAGCYISIFHIEKVRLFNAKKEHNISPELYKQLVTKCTICGFDKIVELHHLDHNHKNNSSTNLIGVCPNHHRMIHHLKHQKEIFDILREKGYSVPEKGYKDGFFRDFQHLQEV